MKRMLCFFAAVWFILMPAVAVEDTPCIAWMEYAVHEETGQYIWQNIFRYLDGTMDEMPSLAANEEGFFISHLNNPLDLCLAVHSVGSDFYTIFMYQEGTLHPLFSLHCPDAFAFLGFQNQTVYYAQQSMSDDGLRKTFVVMEQTANTSRKMICYQSQNWYCPSINAKGEILYTVAQEPNDTIWLHTVQGDEEITIGGFSVWYGENAFLFVRDGALWHYDLIRMTASPWKDGTGDGIAVDLNPFSGDGLYLSADGRYVVYGVSVEEKYLGFILSGYFHKAWQVLSLQTGERSRIGALPNGYDNIHVH